MPIDLIDRFTIDAKDMRETADGYLVAMPRVARTGIQLYRGSEVGLNDRAVVRVYRPPEQVFAKDSMHSFAYKPITNDHPPEPVTVENWDKYSVGNSGGEIVRDGEFVRVPLVVMDKAAVKDVHAGKKQLSVGYSTELKYEAGVTPGGEAYDAIQTAIKANHIAVVDLARGGDKLAIGDRSGTADGDPQLTAGPAADTGEAKMPDVKQTTITVDSISLEMSDTAAAVVQRAIKDAQAKIDDANAKAATAIADAAKAKAEHDATIAKLTADNKVAVEAKDAENAALKKQVEDNAMTPAKLDKLVSDRADVFGKAKAVLGDKLVTDGKTIADVRRQVVDARLADKAKGYTDEQVQIAFDTLTADVKATLGTQGVNDTRAAFSAPAVNATDKQAALTARDKKTSERWKTAGRDAA